MKYPAGLKKNYNKITKYDNRGMNLEDDINAANNYYLQSDIACIYKKPTPISIVKVDYKSRCDAVIKEAYFKVPSTTDYNGVYKGKYIDFEAKETTLNFFPLANIHEHQIRHLNTISKMGGIGFIIVRFLKIDETYILENERLQSFLLNSKRKSIPYEYFIKYGYRVNLKYNPRIDYIKVIDLIMGGKENEN